MIKNNWQIFAIVGAMVACFFLGSTWANLKAEARLAKELNNQLEILKQGQEMAAKLRNDIESRKQEFENEIKNNKVYTTCAVPNAAKLHINSIK